MTLRFKAVRLRREFDVPSQHVVDMISVVDKRPMLKQAYQVINRLQVIGFGCFDQAVKHGTGIGASVDFVKQPGLATYLERFSGLLLYEGLVAIEASVG